MDLEKCFDLKAIKRDLQVCIANYIAKFMRTFCEQEPEFAQAIEQSGKIFQQFPAGLAKEIKGNTVYIPE